MSKLKLLFGGLSMLSITSVIGIANVMAQPNEESAPTVQQPAQLEAKERWSEKARVTEANRRLSQSTSTQRGDRMMCKQEPILGTRLKGMVTCRTASDWRRVSRGFQAELKRTNDKAALAYSSN